MDLSRDELTLLCNALNEILHGPEAIGRQEFQTRTGAEPEEALALWDRLAAELARTRGGANG